MMNASDLVMANRAKSSLRAMDQMVRGELYPQLHYLIDRLQQEKEQFLFDGVRALQSGDVFLPGKAALGLAYVMIDAVDDAKSPRLVQAKATVELLSTLENHSWGIHYFLLGLVKLKKAGLLESACSQVVLATLKAQLDTSTIVEPSSLKLKGLPTNYYGVAFSIARLRQELGWEDASAGEALLAKTLDHYDRHSGEFGFSDETDGAGRFDRYSILLIAEICQRFIETGLEVPERLKLLLRKSVDLAFQIANVDGSGFTFGRSLGPYGDTAVVEILSIAAHLGVLSDDEMRYAYSICCRSLDRFVQFWYDADMRSVNMWEKGRRTDTYRGKHRILGENFSLIHQYLACAEFWRKAGYSEQLPADDLGMWLETKQPQFSFTWFGKGRYQQGLAIYRDHRRVFSLPIINGAQDQHSNSPYYSLPFCEGLIVGIPDGGSDFAQLLPVITLADGARLLPTSFVNDIRHGTDASCSWVEFDLDALNLVGGQSPVEDRRIRMSTRYEFGRGVIRRIDRIVPATSVQIACLSLNFFSFADTASRSDDGHSFSFTEGALCEFSATGFGRGEATVGAQSQMAQSPTGALPTQIAYSREQFRLNDPFEVSWQLVYRNSE